MNGRAWTKADDAAIRKRYPALGPSLGPKIGRSEDTTKRRASALGVRFAGRATRVRARPGAVVTPDLVAWAERAARRYARRFGDPADRFGSGVSAALVRATRTYDGSGGTPFEAFARVVVRRHLEHVRVRGGVSGYRRNGHSARKEGAPSVHSFKDGDAEPAIGCGPVGWEAEYEDFVVTMARRLPGLHGDVIRAVYLECGGGSVDAVARSFGLPGDRAREIHDRAIEMIRRSVGVRADGGAS